MGILALHIKTSATGFVTTRKWKPFSTAYFQTCKYHGISNEEFPRPNVVVFCVTCIFISSIGKKYYNCTFFFFYGATESPQNSYLLPCVILLFFVSPSSNQVNFGCSTFLIVPNWKYFHMFMPNKYMLCFLLSFKG